LIFDEFKLTTHYLPVNSSLKKIFNILTQLHPNPIPAGYTYGRWEEPLGNNLSLASMLEVLLPELHPREIFGHVFQAEGQDFYYDVHTNMILEIEPEMAAVIPIYGTMPRVAFVECLKEDWAESKIHEACESIESARKEEGLFYSQRPKLVPPDPKLSIPGECDSGLHHLVLTVTERCNLRCKYCLHGADLEWVRGHGERSMSLGVALNSLNFFLDRVESDKRPMVSFYGGEALLEWDLIERVIAAGRKHPRGQAAMFIIDTNGVLLNDQAIDLVVREKVFLQVSIDGSNSLHDRNRVDAQGNGTLATILGNLDRLLDRDPTAHQRLSFIATMAPPVDLVELADFFAKFPPLIKHGIQSQPSVRVNNANLSGQNWPAAKSDYLDLVKQVEQAREQYLEAVKSGTREELSPVIRELFEPALIKLHHRSGGKLAGEFTPGGNCRPGKRKLHVTIDGTYQPCERTGQVMELGSLQSGIESTKVLGLQEGFHEAVKGKCLACWALRLCGVCFAAQAEYGASGMESLIVPDRVCEAVRRDQEATLKLLARILKLPKEMRGFLDESVLV
jgi:uncharacterized protein